MAYFHVMIWPQSTEQRRLRELYAINLSEGELRERIIEPYETGRSITWSGRTLPPGDVSQITITQTDHAVQYRQFGEYEAAKSGRDVTNDWITGAPAEAARAPHPSPNGASDPRRVMVVHGRNQRAREAMFTFLRSLSLVPIEWEQAVAETGMGSPHNLDAVRAAMDVAQAVVVILTAEDQAGLLPDLAADDDEVLLRGQPRQNVLLEAGFAMGIDQAKTILVELGPIRTATDVEGLNTVRLTNEPGRRSALRSRLKSAGCDVDDSGTDWTGAPAGGDFEACLVTWQAQYPLSAEASQQPADAASGLHGAIQRVIGELRYNRRLLERAASTGFYWDPRRRVLVAGEWAQEYKRLADEPRLQEPYRLAESAYHGIDQINHVVGERAAMEGGEQGRPIGLIKAYPSDNLDGVIAEVDRAIDALDSVLAEAKQDSAG
jgi:predicted nucleotide-binding protein